VRAPALLALAGAAPPPDVWAHGQRLLLVPVGNAAGLVAVLALATFVRLRWGSRLAGVSLAALAGLGATLALPATARWILGSAPAAFLSGFLPPALFGGGFLLWRRTVERSGGSGRPP
jgi:hypothetical protein